MTDIFPPPFSVVVQEIDALENTETQHGHLMALMRHRAMLAAAPQPPVVEQPQSVTDCHQSQPQGEQQTRYLAGGARYKVVHLKTSGYCIHGLPREMLGQWVAFVDATDNKHMDSQPQPNRQPLTEADLHNIASNYFADEWAQKQAVMMLKDHGIGGDA